MRKMKNTDHDEKQPSKIGLIVVLCTVFLPATILSFGIRALLTKYRQRLSVIASIVLALEIVLMSAWGLSGALDKFIETVKNFTEISTSWPGLLPAYILGNLMLGGVVGLFFAAWEVRQMRIHPHRFTISGNWMYKFKYRRTPLQMIQRNKTIQDLKEGNFASDVKAPLGIDEKHNDAPAYRFDTEAQKHTLVVGASGSGKALHKDTLIPTPRGLRRVGDLKIADEIFDENGNITMIIGKFQPMTEDHFVLTFSDGTDVKACGDHLWQVAEVNKNTSALLWSDETISTREIFERAKTKTLAVRRLSKAVEYEHKDLQLSPRMLGLWMGGTRSNGWLASNSKNTAEGLTKVEKFFENSKESKLVETLDDYLHSSEGQRTSLVSGFADAAGYCNESGVVTLEFKNKEIASKFRMIVASLAWKPTSMKAIIHNSQSNSVEINNDEIMHSFDFTPEKQLFRRGENFRKMFIHLRDSAPALFETEFIYIEKVEEISDNPEDYFCFEVDSESHLFLCSESYIPTHNTITLLSLIYNDIQSQKPIIVIDFKRSPELASKIATWSEEAGRPFLHLVNGDPSNYDVKSSPGQAFYDPLKNGSPTSRADMVLGMREYDTASAVYKAAMQQLLQVLFSMLEYADRSKAPSIVWNEGGINQVVSAMSGSNLTELASACEGTPIQKEAEEIDILSRGKTSIRHAMEELQGQMRTIVASDYGRWLKNTENERNIDLYDATNNQNSVILFSLNSDDEPDFARYIGSMILSDLTSVSARRRNNGIKNQVNVYVDEFQAVPPTSVTSLLEKSRESKIAMTLAQQSFEQIIASSERNGEAYLLSIMDTCSNFIIHNGSTEDSAKRLSKILGMKWTTVFTQSNQNTSSFLSANWSNKREALVQTKEEERWVLEPREFMDLTSPDENNGWKSTAVVINKTSADPTYKGKSGGVGRTIWMIPNKKVIAEYYISKFKKDESYVAPEIIDDSLEINSSKDNEHAPVYQEIDFLAERAAAKKAGELQKEKKYQDNEEDEYDDYANSYLNNSGDDDEEEEGGFSWEKDESIDNSENDDDLELLEASKISTSSPITPVRIQTPVRQRSEVIEELPDTLPELEESLPIFDDSESVLKKINAVVSNRDRKSTTTSSSFSNMFGSDYKPEVLKRTSEKTINDNEALKPNRSRSSSVKPKIEEISENLPDIDEVALPDL